MEALYSRAAKLPRVDLAPPRTLIGKSTIDAIRSGIVYGFAGAVDTILRRMRAEMGECETIATGGLSEHIVPFCEEVDVVDDLLTLNGLRLLHERNR
jgi:type III pantothenate kinase